MRKMIAELEKTECSPGEMAVLEKAKIELSKSKHEFGEALKRTENGIGDIKWLMAETGWTYDKIGRLCRLRQIKGAFQTQPGTRGSLWHFRKAKTLTWLESLEGK